MWVKLLFKLEQARQNKTFTIRCQYNGSFFYSILVFLCPAEITYTWKKCDKMDQKVVRRFFAYSELTI